MIKKLLKEITSVRYATELLIRNDIDGVLTDHSAKTQDVKAAPWDVKTNVEKIETFLEDVEKNLSEEDPRNLKNLSNHFEELNANEPTLNGVKLHMRTASRSDPFVNRNGALPWMTVDKTLEHARAYAGDLKSEIQRYAAMPGKIPDLSDEMKICLDPYYLLMEALEKPLAERSEVVNAMTKLIAVTKQMSDEHKERFIDVRSAIQERDTFVENLKTNLKHVKRSDLEEFNKLMKSLFESVDGNGSFKSWKVDVNTIIKEGSPKFEKYLIRNLIGCFELPKKSWVF